jgi:putative transposase
MASVAGGVESGSMVQVDEEQVRSHVDEVVRRSVEETLNGLLEAEAEELCGAQRYERSPDRMDTRAGSYERRLVTKAGQVTLKVPRLRSLPFETQDQRCASVPSSGTGVGNRAWRKPSWRCTWRG